MPSRNKKESITFNIFEILDILEENERIEKDNFVTSYCDLCGKTHPRQWYVSLHGNFSFYICTVSGKIMCKYKNGRWSDIEPDKLIKKLV